IKHGAVINTIAGGRPGISMRIKMNQADRAMCSGVCPQAWVSDKMISTEHQGCCSRPDNIGDMCLDMSYAQQIVGNGLAITTINYTQRSHRIYIPRPWALPCQR